ncbi:MAG: tetratricopeptide repeat protein, partial [Bacteroidota bacterium]
MSHFKLELNRISIYNPHRLDDKELVNGFIVRHKLFDALLSRIGQEKSDSIPQHHLIIGQRGMGKTTLLRRIEVELRNNEAYNKDFIPLSFPEEQYNLDRLSKFWLNCLDALADTLEVQERMDYVQRLDAQIQVLEKIKEETELVDKAFRLFQKMLEELQQRPVLLIDNLNQIFDALEDREHWGLRNQITKKGCPILIGASAAPLEEAYEYGAAFYDSFLFNYLESLSYAEFFKVIRSLAERVENTQLVASLPTKKGRLQALYTLTGGNPRTTVLLFQVFTNGFSVDIYKDLDALLESITPLYKARFEELSTQLQVIVDAIALHWDPCQLATLRTLTRLENHQLSPQLKRLVDMGWITKIKPSKGKGVAYEIGERFFNVWYLMRRSSRRQKRNLISLTRFLEAFYGEKIDEAARHMIEVKSKHLHHVTIKLALSEATRTKSLRSKLQEGAYSELVAFSKKDRSVLSQFDLPDDSRFEAIYEDFKKLEDEGQYLKLEELLLDFLAKYEESASAWNALGHTRQYDLKKMDEVEECYLKAISLNSKYSYPWNNLGDLYKNHLSRYEESERAYLKSIELDPKSAYPWNGLGNLYKNHLSRYEEAEKAYLKSIEVDPKYS